MKEAYRIAAPVRARLRERAAVLGGDDVDERELLAARARVAFHQGMVPQRGSQPAVWRAWHRESGIAGFQNRHERARAKRSKGSALGAWIQMFFGVAVENALGNRAA